MTTSSQFLFLSLIAIWFISLTVIGATTIHPEEKKALKDIAKSLGKKDWNFSIDPCSNKPNWATPPVPQVSDSNVTCDCSVAGDNFCHVISISLIAQNLTGILPPELTRLRYLQIIDLALNYLSGSIPKEWGSMMYITKISLVGNRLTGSIPVEIANISSLQILELWINQMSGKIPPELGNLTQLQILRLTSNNFTGELPMTLAKLTNLQDFRIEGNQFSGKIPDYIQNWTSIQNLMIQGSGLSGPIPSGISLLRNLTDLRISDLDGSEDAPLPQLNEMTSLRTLILRNCNISGKLPDYLGTMTSLKTLDLSFNKLSGTIPSTYAAMKSSNYIFLTGNLLTGPMLPWRAYVAVDLSYNNFSISQGSQVCDDEKVNLFSTTWGRNNIATDSCLSFECPKPSYSLYINCGGKQAIVNRKSYYGDSDLPGPARFHVSPQENWAFSTTGVFMENDQTFRSLGRRIFDIYLQGKRVQKDFNIAEEAGGVGKKVIKQFNDVVVTSNTLEIRLYWAGKGTMAIPSKSAYGPLISAISVESDSPPGSISAGAVAGIVVAAIIIIILVFGILWWKGCFGKKNALERDLKSLDLQTGLFTLRQIKAATNNFHISNKIGEGGFGPVYKGCLSNGTLIAVKQLSSKSRQGYHQLLLIYEYLENNSLARALFGPEEHQIKLDWSTRQKICVGIAKVPKISDFGLAKLDEEDKTHISTKIAGTYGYMAPEYAMHGYLTDKADVYSFGIVSLEIVSGRSNTLYRSKEEAFYLLDWANMLKEKGDLMELVDRRLGSDFNKKEAMVMIDVALLCTNVTSNLRPSMSSVVSMLEGTTVVPEFVLDSSEVMDEKKCVDLYPVQSDSSYWEKRN
ncbi:putative leucine-rich repeat receptor serine/threonine-protein kinase [Trifolium repens]|nr:putative leucine-rich repeat receptor serine/threonine-protein kinase [Trifolium repens]